VSQWTALLIAAWRERNDVVEYLLSAGANRFWTNSLGRNLDAITGELKQQAALGMPPTAPSLAMRERLSSSERRGV
jgi:ankyrin repeat protein